MKRLFLVLLFLTACGIGQQDELSDIVGTEGLVITLPKLPSELQIGQGLQIPIQLENEGASDVDNAVLTLSGYNENFVSFTGLPKVEGISLEGRDEFLNIGEKTTEIFTIASIRLPELRESVQTFNAIACYQYKTEASPVVCINPKLIFGESGVQTGCDFVDAKISPSQGAPIAVTNVQTFYFANKNEVEFRIFVKDVSQKGILLNKNAYAKRCLSPEPLQAEDLNTVHIEAFLGGQKLNCYEGDAVVDNFKLVKETFAVACRAPYNPAEPAFTTPLSVTLSYGYNVLDTFQITLKNPSLR